MKGGRKGKGITMFDTVPRSDEELLRLVQEISLRDFSLPFRHKCRYNNRLKTTGGRYLLKAHDLEFNPHSVQLHGMKELVGTIRHELCHYHLHLLGKGFRHRDKDFQMLLKQVGGSRYALPTGLKNKRSAQKTFQCINCGMLYVRSRAIDINRYRCGNCNGQLRFISSK